MERRLKLLEFKKDLEEGIQKLEAAKTTAAMLGAAEDGCDAEACGYSVDGVGEIWSEAPELTDVVG